MSGKCPKCGAPAKHMPPDGDFRYDPLRPDRQPGMTDEMREEIRQIISAAIKRAIQGER